MTRSKKKKKISLKKEKERNYKVISNALIAGNKDITQRITILN